MKVDVEKLICFLMSDEVIENNIPESLKLGLEQQGLKCKDGKIYSISKKERSKKPPYYFYGKQLIEDFRKYLEGE